MTTIKTSSALAAALLVLAPGVQASCGSAFCTLLNDRFALGTWDHIGWSADTHLEFVNQDRLRSGTRTLSPSDVTGEDAIERQTRNRDLVTTMERSFDENWSLALRVPVVQRDHVHDLLDAETGAVGPTEQWKFTRVGDVQALGRFQDAWVEQGVQWALLGGFKLPTGSRNIVNADGDRAERALQPGTGTTDVARRFGALAVKWCRRDQPAGRLGGGAQHPRRLQARLSHRVVVGVVTRLVTPMEHGAAAQSRAQAARQRFAGRA